MNPKPIPIVPAELAQAIRARSADPVVRHRAQQRADAMSARLAPHEARLRALADQAIRAQSDTAKLALLRALLDLIGAAAAGNVACHKGCSACCHIAVQVTAQEAAVIGREIGVKVATPARWSTKSTRDDDAERLYGVPCPFLKDDACSIYASRPLACRTQFNVDTEPSACTIIPGEVLTVPYWNHMPVTVQIAQAFIKSMTRYADVREFFPKGKGRA